MSDTLSELSNKNNNTVSNISDNNGDKYLDSEKELILNFYKHINNYLNKYINIDEKTGFIIKKFNQIINDIKKKPTLIDNAKAVFSKTNNKGLNLTQEDFFNVGEYYKNTLSEFEKETGVNTKLYEEYIKKYEEGEKETNIESSFNSEVYYYMVLHRYFSYILNSILGDKKTENKNFVYISGFDTFPLKVNIYEKKFVNTTIKTLQNNFLNKKIKEIIDKQYITSQEIINFLKVTMLSLYFIGSTEYYSANIKSLFSIQNKNKEKNEQNTLINFIVSPFDKLEINSDENLNMNNIKKIFIPLILSNKDWEKKHKSNIQKILNKKIDINEIEKDIKFRSSYNLYYSNGIKDYKEILKNKFYIAICQYKLNILNNIFDFDNLQNFNIEIMINLASLLENFNLDDMNNGIENKTFFNNSQRKNFSNLKKNYENQLKKYINIKMKTIQNGELDFLYKDLKQKNVNEFYLKYYLKNKELFEGKSIFSKIKNIFVPAKENNIIENPIKLFGLQLLEQRGGSLQFKNNAKLTDQDKRIFIRTYYLPMLYLLYGYYYTKFYEIQRNNILRIENNFNYENVKFIFDKKNPVIKRINVYLYENFKKGAIEKLAPVDQNVSNEIVERKEIVIEFLKSINKILEKNIDTINEELKKENQIIYDLNQYLVKIIKLNDLLDPLKKGQRGGGQNIAFNGNINEVTSENRLEKDLLKKIANNAAEKAHLQKIANNAAAAEKARLQKNANNAAAEKARLQKNANNAAAEKARLQKETNNAAAAEKARLQKETNNAAAAEKARLQKETNNAAAAEKARLQKDTKKVNLKKVTNTKRTNSSFKQKYIENFVVSHAETLSKLIINDNLKNLIGTIIKPNIIEFKKFLEKINSASKFYNFINKIVSENEEINKKLKETDIKNNNTENIQKKKIQEQKNKMKGAIEYQIYNFLKDKSNKEQIFSLMKDIFKQEFIKDSNTQQGGSYYSDIIEQLLIFLEKLTEQQISDIQKDQGFDSETDILDLAKIISSNTYPLNLDQIYITYKEAVQLINKVNIDLILNNEYEREEDIITRINLNSGFTVGKIIENINDKIELKNLLKDQYKVLFKKNEELVDILDDEKELIRGFFERLADEKLVNKSSIILKYKDKFKDIKDKLYSFLNNLNFSEKKIDTEKKNNLVDLIKIIYRSIYINEEIENNYLQIKCNQKDALFISYNKRNGTILLPSSSINASFKKKIMDIKIEDYQFYIDNILQRYKKEDKDKTKLIEKRMSIFKKDIEDLKKKLQNDKEIHERDSEVIAQKSREIAKIDAEKKKEQVEKVTRQKQIDEFSRKKDKLEKEDPIKKYKSEIDTLERITVFPYVSRIIGQITNQPSKEDAIDSLKKKIQGDQKYRSISNAISSLVNIDIIKQTNIKQQNEKKDKLEKEIEQFTKLKNLIEYQIKQVDSILSNITSQKSEFNKKEKDKMNFDEFKESFLTTYQSLIEISKKVKDINNKISLNNSKNRFYKLLDQDKSLKEQLNKSSKELQFKNDKDKQNKLIKTFENYLYVKLNKVPIQNKKNESLVKKEENTIFMVKLKKELEVLKDMPSDIKLFFDKIYKLDTEIWKMIYDILQNRIKENRGDNSYKDNYYNEKFYFEYNKLNEKMKIIEGQIKLSNNINYSPNKTGNKKLKFIEIVPYTDCILMYFLSLFNIVLLVISNAIPLTVA